MRMSPAGSDVYGFRQLPRLTTAASVLTCSGRLVCDSQAVYNSLLLAEHYIFDMRTAHKAGGCDKLIGTVIRHLLLIRTVPTSALPRSTIPHQI